MAHFVDILEFNPPPKLRKILSCLDLVKQSARETIQLVK